MAEITIPATTVVVCDRCGARSDDVVKGQSPFYARSAKLTISETSRDLWGSGAGAKKTVDLCCNCCKRLDQFMRGDQDGEE